MTYNNCNVDDPEIATRVISGLREGCTACLSLTDGNESGFNFSTMDTDCIGAIVKNYMFNIDTDCDSVDDMLNTIAYMCESLSQYLYGVMTFNRENYNILKSEYLPEVKTPLNHKEGEDMTRLDGFYVCEFCGNVVDRETVEESKAHKTYGHFIMCESCGEKFIELYNEIKGGDNNDPET